MKNKMFLSIEPTTTSIWDFLKNVEYFKKAHVRFVIVHNVRTASARLLCILTSRVRQTRNMSNTELKNKGGR